MPPRYGLSNNLIIFRTLSDFFIFFIRYFLTIFTTCIRESDYNCTLLDLTIRSDQDLNSELSAQKPTILPIALGHRTLRSWSYQWLAIFSSEFFMSDSVVFHPQISSLANVQDSWIDEILSRIPNTEYLRPVDSMINILNEIKINTFYWWP